MATRQVSAKRTRCTVPFEPRLRVKREIAWAITAQTSAGMKVSAAAISWNVAGSLTEPPGGPWQG